jgi:E3 ubiquitin-protein ligase synoviolin
MPARASTRWTAYAGTSTALAAFVVVKALAQRPNFYSAAVYLSQSSANLMILSNFVFAAASSFLFGLQKLLYGQLRPIEIEQLYERAWFAVTETCLAMTIFRGELGPWFMVLFFSLLASKVWGWIGEGRVEILEQQPPRNPKLFHARLATSLTLGCTFNALMLRYIVLQVIGKAQPDMMVMFGFEFAILLVISVSTSVRYAISLFEIGILKEQRRLRGAEMRTERVTKAKRDLDEAQQRATQSAESNEQTSETLTVDAARQALERAERPVDENEVEVEGWENKGRWIFYLDLATDFLKLVIYLSFFFILLVFYGLPIHIMRDVFLTTRSFFKRIADFLKYRTATRDMNERYPDATAAEIESEDVCIICREEMRPYEPPAPGQPPHGPAVERMRPKKLPCGHILHFTCLRSWLERQQVCPTCRRSVVPNAAGGVAAPGQAGGPANQQGQHPAGDRPGPRIFQFGPLRIGVGAARGNNMFEELQHQLEHGRAAPAAQGNQNGPQQYGIGIRWDGRAQRRRHRSPGTMREQLDSMRIQLQQELVALDHNTREYAVLQTMNNELERLRAARNAIANGQPPPPDATGIPPLPPLHGGPVTNAQFLHTGPSARVVPAGSPQLPEGMVLPEGWSMMPLEPVAAPGIPTAGMPQPLAGQQPPVPDDVRNMFTMPGQPAAPSASAADASNAAGGPNAPAGSDPASRADATDTSNANNTAAGENDAAGAANAR